jgi:hypothetical protein
MITESVNESQLLGLRVGRLAGDGLEASRLRAALVEGAYDLCRVTFRMERSRDGGVALLEALGLPYFYAGGILRYEVDYREKPYAQHWPSRPDLEFVPAGEEHRQDLEALLRASFAEDPIGYYKTPYLAALFDRGREVDCLLAYHLYPRAGEHHTFLVRREGRYVAFLIMQVEDRLLHTPLLGVLPAERGGHLFDPMRDFIHLFASRRGWREVEGARIDNLLSQNVFGQDGLRHVANETVFHITPFLDRGRSSARAVPPEQVEELVSQELPPGLRCVSERRVSLAQGEPVVAEVALPVRTASLSLAVTRYLDTVGAAVGLGYREYRSSED